MEDQVNNHAVRAIFKNQEGVEASPGYQKCLAKLTEYERDVTAFRYGLAQDRANLKGFGRLSFPLWALNHLILTKLMIPAHEKWIKKIKEVMTLPVGFRVGILMEELAEYDERNKKIFKVATLQYRRDVMREKV